MFTREPEKRSSVTSKANLLFLAFLVDIKMFLTFTFVGAKLFQTWKKSRFIINDC